MDGSRVFDVCTGGHKVCFSSLHRWSQGLLFISAPEVTRFACHLCIGVSAVDGLAGDGLAGTGLARARPWLKPDLAWKKLLACG